MGKKRTLRLHARGCKNRIWYRNSILAEPASIFCAGLSDIRFGLSNYKAKTFWLAQEMSTILWLVNNAHNVTYKLHRQKRHKYPKMRNSNLSEVSLGISEPFSSSHSRSRKSRQKKPKVEDVEYDDNLTREESEERINLLLLILAILNMISVTTMSGYELEYRLKVHHVKVIPYVPPIEVKPPRVPHILVIYRKGVTLDYSLDPNVSKPLNFGDLPDSKHYVASFNKRALYTAYIDNGNKDVTKWSGENHRRIKNTNLKLKDNDVGGALVFAKGLRVGKFYWVFGFSVRPQAQPEMSENEALISKTFLWSFEREKWMNGPHLRINGRKIIIYSTCVTNYNDTHVLFYGYNFVEDQLHTYGYHRLALYNVLEAKWTVLKDEDWVGFYEIYDSLNIDKCDSTFTKSGNL